MTLDERVCFTLRSTAWNRDPHATVMVDAQKIATRAPVTNEVDRSVGGRCDRTIAGRCEGADACRCTLTIACRCKRTDVCRCEGTIARRCDRAVAGGCQSCDDGVSAAPTPRRSERWCV